MRRPTRSTASARSRRRSPRWRSCSSAPRACSTWTTASSSTSTGIANGSPTIRRLLAHLSGLQREAGEMFVTGESPTEDELVASMSQIEFVSPPGAQHHYSNLAFALLGQVVARRSGERYIDYVDERIIGPLGLGRTSWTRSRRRRRATSSTSTRGRSGSSPRPTWAERPRPASSGRPSRTWVAGPRSSPRAATACSTRESVEEMWFPQVMYYPDDWVLGWGLGLQLHNQGGAIYGGHGGAMAGHLAARRRQPEDEDRRRRADELRHPRRHGPLRDLARREGGRDLAARRSKRGAPRRSRRRRSRAILGRWWSEGNEFVVWWQDGTLHATRRRARRRARARPSSSATATAGARAGAASAASACASTATG